MTRLPTIPIAIAKCPFCGAEAVCQGNATGYVVRCGNEECAVIVRTELMNTADEAGKAWNERKESQ